MTSAVGSVRPFHARVVRPERAADAVTPLIDPVDEHAEALHPGGVDPTAYDDAGTAFFVYRQQHGEESHTGVVCDVHPVAFVDGRVRGHEAVRPDRVAGLLEHVATGPPRPALAALLHEPGAAFTAVTAEALEREPLLDVDGPDGLRQTVWQVPADEAVPLAAELDAARLYVADGHHRVAATLGQWRSGSSPDDAGLLCAVYPLDGLRLEAFHRRVAGPVALDEVRAVLAHDFDVREVEAPPGRRPGRFGIYADRAWWEATWTGERSAAPQGLDVSVLARHVLDPLTADRPGRMVEVAASSIPLSVLTGRCDADGGVLVTLAPPPLHVLTDLADRGEVMPPKTTFFEPKPCAGIFLRA